LKFGDVISAIGSTAKVGLRSSTHSPDMLNCIKSGTHRIPFVSVFEG
jgi:hypothetical protein